MTNTAPTPTRSRYNEARARSAELQTMSRRKLATILAEYRVSTAKPGCTDFATEMEDLKSESKRHVIQGILAREFDANIVDSIWR